MDPVEPSILKTLFGAVAQHQQLVYSEYHAAIDQVGQEIERALSALRSTDSDLGSILNELKTQLHAIGPVKRLAVSGAAVVGKMDRYTECLDRSFYPDISRVQRRVDLDPHLTNQVIANHAYREGWFDVGDSLLSEAGEPEDTVLKPLFMEMHRLAASVRDRILDRPLSWALANHDRLTGNGSRIGEKLEEVRNLESTHWAWLVTKADYLERLAGELKISFLDIAEQPRRSPLGAVAAAGAVALPRMATGRQVEVGREFEFHSFVVCPLRGEAGSKENPPERLPCGHVLLRKTMWETPCLSSEMHPLCLVPGTHAFLCPQCEAPTVLAACERIYL